MKYTIPIKISLELFPGYRPGTQYSRELDFEFDFEVRPSEATGKPSVWINCVNEVFRFFKRKFDAEWLWNVTNDAAQRAIDRELINEWNAKPITEEGEQGIDDALGKVASRENSTV